MLGEYDKRTLETDDICNATGLSEEAVNVLMTDMDFLKELRPYLREEVTGCPVDDFRLPPQEFRSFFIKEAKKSLVSNITALAELYKKQDELNKDCQYLELRKISLALKHILYEQNQYVDGYEIVQSLKNFLAEYVKNPNDEEINKRLSAMGIKRSRAEKTLQLYIQIAGKRVHIAKDINSLNECERIKEKEYVVWDSFMDIVKAYIKGVVENGREDKLQEEW